MHNNQNKNPDDSSHPGGNPRFWQNEMVGRYDYQQSLLSEQKEQTLANIIRILSYFCQVNNVRAPRILDIGCGPGTGATLSAYILEHLPDCIVVGVDSSNQMVAAALNNLQEYGKRFIAYVGDFNSTDFWDGMTDRTYNFAVSSGSLHYLADDKRVTFLKGIYSHLAENGVFVAGIANCSEIVEIAEMEQIFRAEYTYNQLPEEKKPGEFAAFRKSFMEIDQKANINWKSHMIWLDAMKEAGFKQADIVWHLWVRSLFVGIK